MTLPKPWTTHEQVDNDLGFHPAGEITGAVHDAVRQAHKALAHRMIELLPEGPAKTTAYNKIREAMMWANAAVACQQDPIWCGEVEQLLPIPPLVVQEPVNAMRSEEVAQLFHQEYERLAPGFSYVTRKESSVPWHDVPPANAALMTATVAAVLHRDEPNWVKEVRQQITPDPGPVEVSGLAPLSHFSAAGIEDSASLAERLTETTKPE